jgi:sugar phosphate isomerase/epimerase
MAYPEVQLGEGDFVSTIHQIGQREFFGALELGVINSPKERAGVLKAIEEYNLQIGFGAQPIILSRNLNLSSLEKKSRQDAVQTVKLAIDQASELAATSFVILSGKDPGELLRDQAYVALEETILDLGEHSNQYGMRIVLETFDRLVDKKALVGPSDEAATLAKRIIPHNPKFGLLYDMGHMPLLDETPLQALQVLQGILAEVHLGNCVKTQGLLAFGDKHPRFGFPGGVNDTAELIEFIQALFETGYLQESPSAKQLPWVGFEIRPHEGETTLQVLDNIQKTWRKAWSQL